MSIIISLRRILANSHFAIFFLTFWLGWCTYSLKLVSITKLIDELSFKAYPPLMLALGIVLFASVQIFKKMSEQSEKIFYLMTIFMGMMVVYVGNNPIYERSWIYSCSVFLASAVSIVAIDISSRVFVSKKISILKNPHVAGQISFIFEIGIIAGALCAISYQNINGHLNPIIGLLPFSIAILLVLLSERTNKQSKNSFIIEDHKEKVKFQILDYPFVPLLIGIITIGLICKHIQGYALLIGIKEWKATSSESLTTIFSKLSILQTAIILLALTPSLFKIKMTPTWSRGFNGFLGIQTLSMIFISIVATPLTLIGTGVTRKIIQHAIYNKSLTLLDSTIPQSVRLEIKNIVEKYAQTTSYFVLALFSFAAIYGLVPQQFVWISCALIAITGLFLRKKLQKVLSNFQVSHIVKSNVYEAVAACYSLANKESQSHHAALTSLLKQNPRPLLAKAIIYALGEMQRQENVESIIKYYERIDREDIQLMAIDALMKYKSYSIDLFFQQTLQSIIAEQTSLGEIRSSIYDAIANRIPSVAILTTLNLLEQHKNDYRILANVIEVLSKISQKTKDESLFEILANYVDPKYSRRIRTNALHGLYRSKKFRPLAQECLDAFLTSSDKYDQSAAAYLAGAFQLRGLLPFVYKISEENNHKNSTILISLIKLGYPAAFSLFIEHVLSLKFEPAIVAINQLHTVQSTNLRYKVYFELLSSRPESVMIFMDLLKDSNRNFDRDRQIIRDEAARLNIEIFEDNQLFESNQQNLKIAA